MANSEMPQTRGVTSKTRSAPAAALLYVFFPSTNPWSKHGISNNLYHNILFVANLQDFYNFLLDSGMDPVSSTAAELSEGVAMKRYSRYLDSLRRSSPGGGGRGAGSGGDIDSLMNGSIRKKLKIIPENVTWVLLLFFEKVFKMLIKWWEITCVWRNLVAYQIINRWGGQSDQVFISLAGDFMKPRISEVINSLYNYTRLRYRPVWLCWSNEGNYRAKFKRGLLRAQTEPSDACGFHAMHIVEPQIEAFASYKK